MISTTDKDKIKDISDRAMDLVTVWLAECERLIQETGDDTHLSVYMTAARHFLDKLEATARKFGGAIIEHRPESLNNKGEN